MSFKTRCRYLQNALGPRRGGVSREKLLDHARALAQSLEIPKYQLHIFNFRVLLFRPLSNIPGCSQPKSEHEALQSQEHKPLARAQRFFCIARWALKTSRSSSDQVSLNHCLLSSLVGRKGWRLEVGKTRAPEAKASLALQVLNV